MATQTTKKTCNILMILTLFIMVFSAHITQSTNVKMCIKHCVSNQCTKLADKSNPIICEEACKKLCNKQTTGHEQWFTPSTGEPGGMVGVVCDVIGAKC
ncbi:unnamed protein product [Cochlearia groenlandica]